VGPVTAGAGNVAALYFFVAAGRSYTVEIASTGSSSPAAVTGGYAVDCPTVSGGWPSNIAMTPRSDGRVIRLTIAATASTYIVTRIPTGSVTYSVAETTLYSQSWSTVNGFFTQWGLQNTTDSPITGTLTVTESFGGSSTYTREVTLPANSGVFVTTLDTFVGGPRRRVPPERHADRPDHLPDRPRKGALTSARMRGGQRACAVVSARGRRA
jgi:hypothetical protein